MKCVHLKKIISILFLNKIKKEIRLKIILIRSIEKNSQKQWKGKNFIYFYSHYKIMKKMEIFRKQDYSKYKIIKDLQ